MPDRFFVEMPIEGEHASLVDTEAHHLLHVLRAKPGDDVVLFDGRGCEFLARIEECGRREVVCVVLAKQDVDRESAVGLTLAVALPKGERQRWLVEKLVELGVSRMVPLITDRSVAQPTTKALDRLRRAVIEASKQCGRNVLMQIAEPQLWEPFVNSAVDQSHADEATPCCYVVAHPKGETRVLGQSLMPHDVIAAIGPEGGFTEQEIATARSAGWKVADLGSRILRIETAAIVMATRIIFASE